MRFILCFTISLFVLIAPVISTSGQSEIIVGVYSQDLVEYSESGKKLGVDKDVTDKEINGASVLAISSRKLVKINFRGKDKWFRASKLKFKSNDKALASNSLTLPGRSYTATPVASGMGNLND